MDTPPPLDIEAMLEVLDRHGVDYIIIGGFAVAAHGYPAQLLIVGLGDLVAMKRASGRARDRQDLVALAERYPHLRQAPDLDPPVTTPNDPPEQTRRSGFGRRR